MRKSSLFLLSLISVLSLSACQKEEVLDKPVGFGEGKEVVETTQAYAGFSVDINNAYAINDSVVSSVNLENKLSDEEKEILEQIKEDYAVNPSYTKEGVKEIIMSDEFMSLTIDEKEELYTHVEKELVKEEVITESSVNEISSDELPYDERLISDYANPDYDPMENEVGVYDETVFYTDEEIKAMQENARKLYEENKDREPVKFD